MSARISTWKSITRVKRAAYHMIRYHLSRDGEYWSDWADADAVLNIRLAHTHFADIVLPWVILWYGSRRMKPAPRGCWGLRSDNTEPRNEIFNNMVCATSKGSDQSAHTRSLIRAFASRLNIQLLLSYWPNNTWSFLALQAAAQARLCLLMSKCHIVGNHVSRLNNAYSEQQRLVSKMKSYR